MNCHIRLCVIATIAACFVHCAAAEEKSSAKTAKSADATWEAQQSQLPIEKRPFDIKGDRLGMSLAAFKRKYHRDLGRNKPPAPHCSDESPDKDNPMLFYKADMARAGIVAAATTYPHEAFESPPVRPTIAGVAADSFIYKFVDGKLYEISIAFDQRNFSRVKAALNAKFPSRSSQHAGIDQHGLDLAAEGETIIWSNDVSTIMLCQHAGDRNSSLMLVNDKTLSADAEKRLSKVRASKETPLSP